MTWTKKDYEAVAEVLYTTELTEDERDFLSHDFGLMFHADNPSFSFGRFYAAVTRGELTRRSGKQPAWTSKTFKAVAKILKTGKDAGWLSAESHARLVRQFAEKSARTNPRFDSVRFERAAFRHPQSVPVKQYRRRR